MEDKKEGGREREKEEDRIRKGVKGGRKVSYSHITTFQLANQERQFHLASVFPFRTPLLVV